MIIWVYDSVRWDGEDFREFLKKIEMDSFLEAEKKSDLKDEYKT